MQYRLVAVPIAEHEVARPYHAMPHDLVCGRCAANDEQRVVSSEDPGRIPFALGNRSGVIEQRSERTYGNGDIRTNRILAEEVVEELPDRALAKRNPAAVPRRVPGEAR